VRWPEQLAAAAAAAVTFGTAASGPGPQGTPAREYGPTGLLRKG